MFHIDSSQLTPGFQKNAFGEEYLYAVNQNTFAKVSSELLFQHEYADTLQKENTLYLIIGTDSGLLINYLFAHPPAKGSTYLLIEFTEVIEQALLDFQPDENKRIYLTDYAHWQEVAKQYDLAKYSYINHIDIIQSMAVKDNFLAQYRLLWKQIEQQLSEILWHNLASSGARVFIQTQIENLNENQFSAIKLKGIYAGKTAVLLAGGPSLDLYIDWVQANRNKFIVIAVSRIARRLQQCHIVPDFFTAIDPHHVGFEVSKEMLNFSQQSILLSHYHLNPRISSQWQGKSFFVGPRYPWDTPRQPEHANAPGPTVTNVALQMAILMGFKQVILLGVDLCYSPEGYSHASGSMEHSAGPMTNHIGQLVNTNDGSIAETDNAFFNAVKSLAFQAKQAKLTDCRFINPSPQAAQVEHIDYIPIKQLTLDKDIEQSTVHLIQSLLPKDLQQAKTAHYHELIDEIKRVRKQLKKIITLTIKGLSYNALFFKNDSPQENFKYKLKMDKVENHLNNDFGDLSNLCRTYGMEAFLEFLKPVSEDLDNKEVKEWADIYYKAYKLGASDLNKLLKKALVRSEKRLQELSTIPNISELCQYWIADHSPARALIYQQQAEHYNHLSPAEQKQIDDVVHVYNEMLNAAPDSTIQYARVQQRADLNGSEIKAYDLFAREDQQGLQRMIQGLKNHQSEEAPQFLKLAEAYLAELQGQTAQAIAAYEQITSGHALEAALKQLVVIYLGSNELIQAERVLYDLASLSIAYVPKLANLYKIQKRYKDALDTYTNYLDVFPEDILTLAKLASLYQELGENEAAQFVYKHILTIDDSNHLAKTYLQQLTTLNP